MFSRYLWDNSTKSKALVSFPREKIRGCVEFRKGTRVRTWPPSPRGILPPPLRWPRLRNKMAEVVGPRASPFAIWVSCSAGPVSVLRIARTSVRFGRLVFAFTNEKERKREEKPRREGDRFVRSASPSSAWSNSRNFSRKREPSQRKDDREVWSIGSLEANRSHGRNDDCRFPGRIGASPVRAASGPRGAGRRPESRYSAVVAVVVVIVAVAVVVVVVVAVAAATTYDIGGCSSVPSRVENQRSVARESRRYCLTKQEEALRRV